jgi:hypothetical protein
MSLYLPFSADSEPNETNIRTWMDNLSTKLKPIEQARWNQANIDTLFYAGSQSFVNRYFNFQSTSQFQQYYFNLIQQPVNMITGYQRQHRKSPIFAPTYGADPQTTDQYTRVVANQFNENHIHEEF